MSRCQNLNLSTFHPSCLFPLFLFRHARLRVPYRLPGASSESGRKIPEAPGHQVAARSTEQALRYVVACGGRDRDVYGRRYGGDQGERRSPRHLR